MMVRSLSIEEMVMDLLTVLDNDIRHLEDTISTLNKLRRLVIRRDDAGLSKLFEEIETKVAGHSASESRRQSIRKALADALGCEKVDDVTLSKVETVLPADTAAEVVERRVRIRSLVSELRREYSATVLLMTDCARFNRLLLESILALNRSGTITYGADGTTKRQSEGGLVNLRF
jgi:flagellar biosynthesis/type III secretory pathway chaperone